MITVLKVGMSDAIVKKRWLGVIFKQGCKKVKSHDLAEDFLFQITGGQLSPSRFYFFSYLTLCRLEFWNWWRFLALEDS